MSTTVDPGSIPGFTPDVDPDNPLSLDDPTAPTPDLFAGLTGTDRAEAVHGFTFGDPDGEHARAHRDSTPDGIVTCVNPRCDRRGEMVQVFTDTALPLHCGGCFTLLKDDPDRPHPDQSIPRAGHLGDPLPDATAALIEEVTRRVLDEMKAKRKKL